MSKQKKEKKKTERGRKPECNEGIRERGESKVIYTNKIYENIKRKL